MAFIYPPAFRDDTIKDNYHGVEVDDPYRWLENANIDRTRRFIYAQNQMAKAYVNKLKYREHMKKQLEELCSFPRFKIPFKEGENYYQFRNKGEEMDILYYGKSLEEMGTKRNEFFNPNKEIPKNYAILNIKFSRTGKIMAIILHELEEDTIEVCFKDVETKTMLKQTIKNLNNPKIEWLNDQALIYSSFVDKVETESILFQSQQLIYTKLGTLDEKVLFKIESGQGELYSVLSECGNYLLIFHTVASFGSEVYYMDLKLYDHFETCLKNRIKLKGISLTHDAHYEYIANDENMFVFRTNKDAPEMKIVNINIENSDEKYWVTLVAENPEDFLEKAIAVNQDYLVSIYRKDARHIIKVNSLKTGVEIMDLPIEIGAVSDIWGRRNHTELFLKFQSMVIPSIIYKIDFKTADIKADIFQQVRLREADNYEIIQEVFESRDLVDIKMYMLYKKGLVQNGLTPCLLSTYGGQYDYVYPKFSIHGVFFVNSFNGIYAVANVRGGGQLGEKWYNAGTMDNKQKAFDDFQMAAKFLFEKKYTSPSRLTIYGSLRGGLLVSVCVNQSPESFGAAIVENADLDILRHNNNSNSTTQIVDYGHPYNPQQFGFLKKFSPLHNIVAPKRREQYPAMLLFVDNKKNKHKIWQSLKFIAKLQHVVGKLTHQKNPLLIEIDTYTTRKSKSVFLEQCLNMFCFIGKSLDLFYDEYPYKKKSVVR